MVGKDAPSVDKLEDDELQEKKPFVPEFCFIPAEPGNARIQPIARSHVMREFKRRERWQYNKGSFLLSNRRIRIIYLHLYILTYSNG
jgi:hypothetical protein